MKVKAINIIKRLFKGFVTRKKFHKFKKNLPKLQALIKMKSQRTKFRALLAQKKEAQKAA
jgi:hypothetical protein